MTVKLIAIDMDATLLRDDKSYDKDAFNQATRSLMDQGVIFCIATGNVVHKLVSYFEDEIKKDLYFAADNGNYLFKEEGIIHVEDLPRQDLFKALKHLEGRQGYYPAISTGMTPYVLKEMLTPELEAVLNIYFDYMELVDRFEDIPKDLPILKLAMYTEYSLEENKKLMEEFNALLPNARSVTSGGSWLDIYSKTGGKGAAIAYLQEKYKISADETMAFGDSLNDASMLKKARYSVAMENADPSIKKMSRYTIGSNEDQAVIAVLEELASGKTAKEVLGKNNG